MVSTLSARQFQKVLLNGYMVGHGKDMSGIAVSQKAEGNSSWLLATDQMHLPCVDIRISLGRNLGGHWVQLLIQSSVVGIWPLGIRKLAALWDVTVFVVIQSLSCVQLFATPRTAAHQASLSFSASQSLLMSIESMLLSNRLILCCRLLLLPSMFPKADIYIRS